MTKTPHVHKITISGLKLGLKLERPYHNIHEMCFSNKAQLTNNNSALNAATDSEH